MKIKVSGKNMEVTDALKERAVKKLSKLNKFFDADTEANVTMSVEKNRHIFEVTILFNGVLLRAEVENDDMYAAIDKSVDILERQIRRYKTRLAKKLREGSLRIENYAIQEEIEEEKEFKVVRSKKFSPKPMTVEEAILQMNLLGHEFFVFFNAETKDTNVVYKRKDGNYGLIEPEY
ncbi:MAG TPA: ribosome-associated translation inhibitor RaiA [Clostridiaceae bacterium]|nr:ribosome-associated translation inhibitor RaiA [Clostridiaceae bacterium]